MPEFPVELCFALDHHEYRCVIVEDLTFKVERFHGLSNVWSREGNGLLTWENGHFTVERSTLSAPVEFQVMMGLNERAAASNR